MTLAFSMARFQRIIATSDTQVRGSFIVHGQEEHSKVFEIQPLDVVLYSEGGDWGRIVRYGDFDVDGVREGVPVVGRIHNDKVRADIEDARDLINEALPVVLAAFMADDGRATSSDSARADG